MAVTAKIKFVQGALTPPPGEALIGVTGVPVTASNEDNSNVETMTWTVVDVPPTSAVPIGVQHFGSPINYIFTPDRSGGYLLWLTVTDLAGNRADFELVFQVEEPSGFVIPPFMATAPMLNFGAQKRGWAKYIESILRALLALGGGASGRSEVICAGVVATNQGSALPTRVGGFLFDVSAYPATAGGLTRVVRFFSTVFTSNAAAQATVQLLDLTNPAVPLVLATVQPASSTDPTTQGVVVTVGINPNQLPETPTEICAIVYRAGGDLTMYATHTNSKLVITYE
jgi:hypothetical protein